MLNKTKIWPFYASRIFCIKKLTNIGSLNTQDMSLNPPKILATLFRIWQNIMEKVSKYLKMRMMSLKLHKLRNQQAENRGEGSPKKISKSLCKKLRFLLKLHQEFFRKCKLTWERIGKRQDRNYKTQ